MRKSYVISSSCLAHNWIGQVILQVSSTGKLRLFFHLCPWRASGHVCECPVIQGAQKWQYCVKCFPHLQNKGFATKVTRRLKTVLDFWIAYLCSCSYATGKYWLQCLCYFPRCELACLQSEKSFLQWNWEVYNGCESNSARAEVSLGWEELRYLSAFVLKRRTKKTQEGDIKLSSTN